MEEFPSQSHKAREPREIQAVVMNPGRVRKTPGGRRFLETFFQADARTTWTSMIWETFFPNLRDNIEDSVHNGISTLFGGTGSGFRQNRRAPRNGGSIISKHNPDRVLSSRGGVVERFTTEDRANQNFRVIEIDSRAEAEEVLRQMNLLIDEYDQVALAEFYQMVKVTPAHTDYKYGWYDIGGTKVVHSRGYYFLDLPDPVVLNAK